ncbi:exodeoxyribonuclease VII small subunit [Myxococcota bacterium]|nr:exodeoxyribonuclease VII small subunit [Myxococcota bacterium]
MAKRKSTAESENGRANPDKVDTEEATSFEEGLVRLEAIVDRLERGELDLEAALGAFEEGVALTRRCAGQLDDAERRIEVLMEQGGEWLVRPHEDDEEEA